MNLLKEVWNNPKSMKIIIAILIVILLIVIITPFSKSSKKEEKELTKELETLGKDYYENYYYNQLGGGNETSRENILSLNSNYGIQINLENIASALGKEKEIYSKFKNTKENKECNHQTTKVTIYPTKPFKQQDYTIETTLDCGYSK